MPPRVYEGTSSNLPQWVMPLVWLMLIAIYVLNNRRYRDPKPTNPWKMLKARLKTNPATLDELVSAMGLTGHSGRGEVTQVLQPKIAAGIVTVLEGCSTFCMLSGSTRIRF